MDTDIKERIADFRAPPPYPDLSKPAPEYPPRLTVERLDHLDRIAQLAIKTKSMNPPPTGCVNPLRIFLDLNERERIYVALAASDEDLLHFLRLTIPQAIDRLGWVDASAMVARWRNRRA